MYIGRVLGSPEEVWQRGKKPSSSYFHFIFKTRGVFKRGGGVVLHRHFEG